ncbi:MAG: hypothetical protein QXD98_00965 [Candidatus Diapherotrites archaeon]
MRFKPGGRKGKFFPTKLKSKEWGGFFGKDYGLELKQKTLVPLIRELDRKGLLGRNFVDVGSGAQDIITKNGLAARAGFLYDTERKKVLRIDLAFDKEKIKENVFEMPLDIETKIKTFSLLRKIARAKKFFENKPVDTFLLSDVLNYVDYEQALTNIAKFLRKNGLIIIFNKPGRGFESLFSEKGVKNNDDLLRTLRKLGFKIIHCADINSSFPTNKKIGPLEHIILVAQKI